MLVTSTKDVVEPSTLHSVELGWGKAIFVLTLNISPTHYSTFAIANADSLFHLCNQSSYPSVPC